MTANIDAAMGFAPDYDSPVPYMQRTREYYKAIGYDPYRWAHYLEVPFAPMAKALSEARIGLITTAAPMTRRRATRGRVPPISGAILRALFRRHLAGARPPHLPHRL
ncbi:hypothetical protein ACFQU2_09095 [Siccirubricoccus deserti]